MMADTMNVRPLLEEVSQLITAELSQILARRNDITWKPDGSPVTAADIYVENLVREFLSSRIKDIEFVGEESFDPARMSGGRHMVLLDPIDGTENFCSGLKEWGVSFGFWRDRAHLGSMLLLPELGERLMTGDRPPRRQSRIVGFSSSFHEAIVDTMREVRESRITGCAVYNLYNVACGVFARFINPKGAYAWDLLPGLMLALEQGCNVLVDGSPFDGKLLDPDRRYRVDIRHRYDLHPGQGSLG
jgi:myo-inositol-1(or 4)-monophosphatase